MCTARRVALCRNTARRVDCVATRRSALHFVATRRGAWHSCFAPQFGPSKLTVDTLVQFTVMQDKVARLTEGENSVEIRVIESDDEAREAECAPPLPVPHPRRDLPTSAPGLAAGTTS